MAVSGKLTPYQTAAEFEADMELMFANAESFNIEVGCDVTRCSQRFQGSGVYLDSLRLRRVYEQAMATARMVARPVVPGPVAESVFAPCPGVEPIPAAELPALAIEWRPEPAAPAIDRLARHARHARQCELMDQEYCAAEVARKRLRDEVAATDDARARLRLERHTLERQTEATLDAVRLMTQQVAGLGRAVETIRPIVAAGEAACGEMTLGLQALGQMQQGMRAIIAVGPRFAQLARAFGAFFGRD